MLLVVNSSAHGGRAGRCWPSAYAALRRLHPDVEVRTPASAADARNAIDTALAAGHTTVIAAGGDGTVNLALNALMDSETDRPRGDRICLGAIGMGSSNDFHRPFDSGSALAGLPVRIDTDRARLVDVGKATIESPDGSSVVRYFLLNASIGVVAQGNDLFNNPGRSVRWLKSRNSDLAIAVCAVGVIAGMRYPRITAESDGWRHDGEVANIGIAKSVHFAGGMHYDTGVVDDDGSFDVNIWRPDGRWALVRTVLGLYRGQFRESPTALCHRSEWVTVRSHRPYPVELDGEVLSARAVRFDVLPARVKVCS